MSWFDPNDLETMGHFGALVAAVEKPSAELAKRLNVLAATAREMAGKSVIAAADAAKIATAWDQVTIQVRTELAAVQVRVTNPQTILRAQQISAALANVDWYGDFARVVGQEASALAKVSANAGTVLAGLDVFITASVPDATSYAVGSSAFSGLIGIGVGIIAVAFLPATLVGGLIAGGASLGAAILAKGIWRNSLAPKLVRIKGARLEFFAAVKEYLGDIRARIFEPGPFPLDESKAHQ